MIWRATFLVLLSSHILAAAEPPVLSPIPATHRIFGHDFHQHVEVFGVRVFATKATPAGKVLHAANVLAQYLDNDEDGEADNSEVLQQLRNRRAFVFMTARENGIERLDPDRWQDAGFHAAQFLFGSETNPGRGRFDASLEEVWHLISDHGFGPAYPEAFGRRRGSQLAECMDLARGGYFRRVPFRYPPSAWYSYEDRSCDYRCQLSEYFYWSLTSLLGAQARRAKEIEDEWRLPTAALLKSGDPRVYRLLTDPRYQLPSRLPDGHYGKRTRP